MVDILQPRYSRPALLEPMTGEEMLLLRRGPEMRAYDPSLRDRVGYSIYDMASQAGLGGQANRMRDEGTVIADFMPGIGDAIAFDEAGAALGRGDYGEAALLGGLASIGVIPGAGPAIAKGAREAGRKGIRAFHGSPHDFDRFDMSKIGTGEGAQAYGHGLYFADSEDVARSYRDALAQTVSVDGKPLLHNNRRLGSTGDPSVDDVLIAHNGNLEAAIAEERAFADSLAAQGRQTSRRTGGDPYELVRKLEDLKGRVDASNDGRMYEVNINANPDDFLDWDLPVTAQPQRVQDLARSADISHARGPTKGRMKAFQEGRSSETITVPTGADLYRSVSGYGEQSVAGSRAVHDAGIPGIKYLDAGSRGAGDGSRNYVVFDPAIIEIVRKYGLAGALGAGLISQQMAEQMQAQGMGEL